MKNKTKENIQESYEYIEQYLNDENCCEELHKMCDNCEKYCGVKEHDYSECRDMSCFENYLAFFYLDLCNGYNE